MAKKSFKNNNNPAAAFISQSSTEEKDIQDILKANKIHLGDTLNTNNTHNMYNKHKTDNAVKKETKSKRLNLLIKPSLYKDIEKIAAMKRTSVNDLINTVLENHIKENQSSIQKYDEVFEGE